MQKKFPYGFARANWELGGGSFGILEISVKKAAKN